MTFLSILHIEQRVTPSFELNKLLELLYKTPHLSNGESFVSFINHNFHFLPYRGTSRNFEEYFNERGFYFKPDTEEDATTTLLQLIIFYYSFVKLVQSNYDSQNIFYGHHDSIWDNLYQDFQVKLEYISTSLLPALNYQLTFSKQENQYNFYEPLITKRNADVDSVLLLINDTDIQLDLLSYLDFRLEKSLQAKQDILVRLYKKIIDDEKETYFTSTKTDDFRLKYQNELYERIKQLYNQTDIRHGGKGKVELTEADKLKYYDMCFYLLLHLIRSPKTIKDMREIKQVFNPQK